MSAQGISGVDSRVSEARCLTALADDHELEEEGVVQKRVVHRRRRPVHAFQMVVDRTDLHP